MARLKIYDWEQETFKDLYSIYLLPKYRAAIIDRLARFFGIQVRWVTFDSQSWGHAYARVAGIKLPKRPFSVGLAIHELAHLHNYQVHGNRGHRGTFKKSLIKLGVESRYELPRILKAMERG
jgi:hypothetical protein